MSASIEIRPVAETDVKRLDVLYPEAAPESRHAQRWRLQARGGGVYLVAWRDDEPVGWVFVHRPGSREASERAQQLDTAEIMDLQVSERFRGQGYGSSLLMQAEQVAREADWTSIGLEVTVSNPHNDVARAMYARHGYGDSGFGVFESGYEYWTSTGERRWDGEPHLFLVKTLSHPCACGERGGEQSMITFPHS